MITAGSWYVVHMSNRDQVHAPIGACDAARELRVSRSTVQRMALRGQLAHTRAPGPHGGTFLFDRAEVLALAAERARA